MNFSKYDSSTTRMRITNYGTATYRIVLRVLGLEPGFLACEVHFLILKYTLALPVLGSNFGDLTRTPLTGLCDETMT